MNCENTACPFHCPHDGQRPNPIEGLDLCCSITNEVKQVRFSKGQLLFAQGQPSASLYAIETGLVKITSHTPDGREQIVGLSAPGNLVVGLQSLSSDYYEYSALAATDGVACKVRHRSLMLAAKTRGDVALSLITAFNAQLAHSREMMLVIGQKCAEAKIASFIMLVMPKSARGNKRLTLPFSRAEIANLLGLSEETVCRQMAELKRKGIIYAPRGKIEIHDWKMLRKIAGDNAPAKTPRVNGVKMGWTMGLEPTTTGITTRGSTN